MKIAGIVATIMLFTGSFTWLGKDVPNAPMLLFFEEGATLEEVTTALQPYQDTIFDRGGEQFRWAHDLGIETWSGGIQYDVEKENITAVRSKHWKRYFELITWSANDLESHITDPQLEGIARENALQQYEDTKQEQAYLQEHIEGCWETDRCPSVPVTQVEIILQDYRLANELEALPVIEYVERPGVIGRTIFFWTMIYHNFSQAQSRLQAQ